MRSPACSFFSSEVSHPQTTLGREEGVLERGKEGHRFRYVKDWVFLLPLKTAAFAKMELLFLEESNCV